MTKQKSTKPGYGKILDAWIPHEDAGQPVGCVVTSFTFSAVLFEEECLGRFLQLETDPKEDGALYLVEREEKMRQLTCAAALVDQPAVVIGLRIERLELFRLLESRQRFVVPSERAVDAAEAGLQAAVPRLLRQQLLVCLRGFGVASFLEVDRRQIAVAARRTGIEVAEGADPKGGGLIEVVGRKPTRFTDMLMYLATTVDPIDLLTAQGMTDIAGMMRTGNGRILGEPSGGAIPGQGQY